MTTTRSLVVVVGGEAASVDAARFAVPAGSVVVAADSGLDAAVAAGLGVHHVVGDLDSVDPALLADAEAAGATVHRHAADKDATDRELAVDLALALLGPTDGGGGPRATLLVLGGGGGRLDHLLADLLGLAAPSLAHVEVTARFGQATVTVVRPGRPRRVAGQPGDQVSIVPVHGRAGGVATEGLRWALVDADLVAGTTRAVSNELLGPTAEVAVGDGVLLVVQPGTRAGVVAPRATPYDPTPRG